MAGDFALALVALDMVLIALAFWAIALRHWRALGGAVVALFGSLPTLVFGLNGMFHLPALLLWLASLLAGGAFVASGFLA